MGIKTIILAAGQGTRMRSKKPKILHRIAGISLLEHVYKLSAKLSDNQINIVYGHGAELVLNQLQQLQAKWIEQREQLGTGHAVQQAKEHFSDEDTVLILYGDVPLLKLSTLEKLLQQVADSSMGLLTVNLDNPDGYGRIIRDADGRVVKIIEHKDANVNERTIQEVNTGIMAVQGNALQKWLGRLSNQNAQKEYYLTDVIAMAAEDHIAVKTAQPDSVDEVLGVNDRKQLAYLERVYQLEYAEKLMTAGVTLKDPARLDIRGEINLNGSDIEIDVNVILVGKVSLGNNVTIGPNVMLINSIIEDDVEILSNCVIENATVGKGSRIGPFARIRPETQLGRQVHIGNFVEIKKSKVDDFSKINHLSYIGDTEIGKRVNVGAGTITCNYDGANKFKTVIQDGAFIGSDTQLVAPVTVGKDATIGAGSTITKNTPDEQLTLTRNKQISVAGWKRPVKQEK